MKEEYGSGFDGTPEQALKYAQDTPGQELEVKRLLKLIRNKKMSKTLKTIKEVVKDKLLREQEDRLKSFSQPVKKQKRKDPIGDLIRKTNEKPPLPKQNPLRNLERHYEGMKKQMDTPSYMDKSKKQWIANSLKIKGNIFVDTGAAKIIKKSGKSLLPVGIKSISGNFQKGDLVAVCDSKKVEIACGLTNYDSKQLKKIIGKTTSEIRKEQSMFDSDVVIHTDNMILSQY